MGSQFLHVYAFSREGKYQVSGILGEAFREKGCCPHVADPQGPEILEGSREDLEKALISYADGWKDSRGHRLRKDGRILRGDVVSWPPGMGDQERKAAEIKTIAWYQKTYGSAVRLCLAHHDEPFRTGDHTGQTHHHLHIYLVGEPNQHFEDLHPGLKAKRQAEKDEERGNLAYKAAMRGLQDKFHQEVGESLGLSRLGPNRARWSQKVQAALNQRTGEIAYKSQKKAQEKLETLQVKEKALEAREKAVEAQEKALEGKKKALQGWEGELRKYKDKLTETEGTVITLWEAVKGRLVDPWMKRVAEALKKGPEALRAAAAEWEKKIQPEIKASADRLGPPPARPGFSVSD